MRCGWGLCDPWHSDPYGEFESLQVDALAAVLGVDGPRQEMLDAARRVVLEVEAEAYERRLHEDPELRAWVKPRG